MIETGIKIIVAAHKAYRMPEDALYLPVQVGAAGREDLGFQRDDDGENISVRNKNYCELTGLYWAWKNLKADYIGLAHYRRHFCRRTQRGDKWERILTLDQARKLVRKCDIILPKPRNYFIETNYSQYVHAHHAEDLETTRAILSERYPEYLKAYDETMRMTAGHRFNMFIMKYELFDAYCKWLFDVLFELENRLDISGYSANDARVFGFVSERLLDVWLRTNGLAYLNVPYAYMESQNWFVKGANFLKRKFRAGR